MIISKIINKYFKITLIMFLLLSVFTLINYNPEKVLRTNVEINNIEEVPKTEIYLLSNDDYLVKANIYLENSTLEEKAKKIIEYLKVNNKKLISVFPECQNLYFTKSSIRYVLRTYNVHISFTSVVEVEGSNYQKGGRRKEGNRTLLYSKLS